MITTTRWTRRLLTALTVGALALGLGACGNESDKLGVGAQCSSADDCNDGQSCLSFKGGYCGDKDCMADSDCPAGSACVTFEGSNYCFLVCADKPECNRYRPVEDESNCSANLEFLEDRAGRKVCVPPSGG